LKIENPQISSSFIFAGGGTGGHLYPGLSVAGELSRLAGEATIVFACSNRAIDRRILDPLPYAVVPQAVEPLPRSAGKVWPFLRAWRASKAQARRMIADLRPRAVVGLGGFAAAPVVRAAAAVGIPTALLNPDAVPGKANRYLARRVGTIFTQFDATAGQFDASLRGKVVAAGCPIRGAFAGAGRARGVEHFGLDAGRKTLLVSGGSLGAEALNLAIGELAAGPLAAYLAESWQVIHVMGPSQAAPDGGETPHVHRLEYCDRMELALSAADLAVMRGGASTIAELTATGTPAIIVPYPHHRDRQQFLNAAELTAAGAAVVCEQTDQPLSRALGEALGGILDDPQRLANMRDAARGMGKADAAQNVARWMIAEKEGQTIAERWASEERSPSIVVSVPLFPLGTERETASGWGLRTRGERRVKVFHAGRAINPAGREGRADLLCALVDGGLALRTVWHLTPRRCTGRMRVRYGNRTEDHGWTPRAGGVLRRATDSPYRRGRIGHARVGADAHRPRGTGQRIGHASQRGP